VENKRYIQDITDERTRKLIGIFACIKCGVIAESKTSTHPNGTSTTMLLNNWIRIGDKRICPLCVRKEKIKKILSGK